MFINAMSIKSCCWHKFHWGVSFSQGGGTSGPPIVRVTSMQMPLFAAGSSTHVPVSHWPTTMHWRQTDRQTDGHHRHIKAPLSSRGLQTTVKCYQGNQLVGDDCQWLVSFYLFLVICVCLFVCLRDYGRWLQLPSWKFQSRLAVMLESCH